ncbi:MAG: nucleoside hydrolase [Thermaerobacter sp.]|nr:nucleoside hydrolase [Thermaerobacter sp.]
MALSKTLRPVILDVDTGIDDAWALVYAAHSPNLELLGVTTVFGNADLETTTRNTLCMLDLLGANTPVYQGADRPLLREWAGPVPRYHGDNGLGNATLPPVSRQAESQHAAQFIREQVRSRAGQITLVTVARLTNLARALLYEPGLAALIDRVVMMGGAAFCAGNVTAVAEANIWGDPEAADIVFRSGVPITMVGLDVTMQARLRREDLNRLDPALPYAKVLQDASEYYIRAYEQDSPGIHGWCPLHDPLAVAVADDPSLVGTETFPVRVETQGQRTDGMTIVDRRDGCAGTGAEVALTLDIERFLSVFRARVGMH